MLCASVSESCMRLNISFYPSAFLKYIFDILQFVWPQGELRENHRSYNWKKEAKIQTLGISAAYKPVAFPAKQNMLQEYCMSDKNHSADAKECLYQDQESHKQFRQTP